MRKYISVIAIILLLLKWQGGLCAQEPVDSGRLHQILEATERYVNRDIRDTADFKSILELKQVYDSIQDTTSLALASWYLGVYYRSIFVYSESEKYLYRGMKVARKDENWSLLMEMYKEIAIVHRNMGHIRKLKASIDASMLIAKRYNVGTKMLIPLMETALYYSYDTENYDLGIKYGELFLEKSKSFKKIGGSDPMLNYRAETEAIIIKMELAKCYIKTGEKMDLVLPYLDEARHFFGNYDDHEKLSRIYQEYVNYYMSRGDMAMVKVYMPKQVLHAKLSDQQLMNRTNEIPKFLSALLQLKQDLELSKMANKKLVFQRGLVIGILILIITVVAVYLSFSARNRRIQKELNESLTAQNKLLETVSAEKSRFFAILSHELRTPIYAITGLTSVINIKEIDPQQINAIKHSGNYLLFLINNILKLINFEQSANGQVQVEVSSFDLTNSLTNIVESSSYFATQNNINLNLQLDWKGECWVKGERRKLAQVIINLIVNAIKYSQDDNVLIAAKRTEETVSHYKMLFKVADNGVGISKEKQQQLFNYTERIEEEPTNNPFNLHGMGIGLFVVNKLLTELGSKIEVDSTPGEGSTFSFELYFEKSVPEFEGADLNDIQRNNPGSILVVDDNRINLMVAKKMIEKLSYTCHIAADTDDILSIITNNNIGLVLMDINMPSLNGYEWSKKIRATMDIPIIAHTAVVEEELDMEMLQKSGIQNFITKPYTIELLEKTIQDTLVRF